VLGLVIQLRNERRDGQDVGRLPEFATLGHLPCVVVTRERTRKPTARRNDNQATGISGSETLEQ
jgi:hypothetical protein